jgi:hypothetical protein
MGQASNQCRAEPYAHLRPLRMCVALGVQFRHVANHLLFRTALKRTLEINGEKPIAVPAGA